MRGEGRGSRVGVGYEGGGEGVEVRGGRGITWGGADGRERWQRNGWEGYGGRGEGGEVGGLEDAGRGAE